MELDKNPFQSMLVEALVLLCSLVVLVQSKELGDDPAIRQSDQEWLNSLFYLPTEPRVRKEYRMLTDEERWQFNDAFVQLKHDTSVLPNKYDMISSLHHRRSTRNSAHRGTGFLGWHRVFTLLMENAIREIYPNITMAYWDTTLDAVLHLPRESCLWSEDFMGNGDGFVQTGVFKDWDVQTGKLYRTVGAKYAPLGDRNISYLMQFDHIGNISFPLEGKNVENVFEETHNRVHHFVGGEMRVIESAADDPVFFPYHSFVSLVWEGFRTLQRMKGIDPETDWDEYYGHARHHKYSPMGLGNLLAIDGSSELFAENIVFYDRPICSLENTDCGTPHLYCNVTVEKCCPWTTTEYKIIKKAAGDNKLPFAEAVIPFVESKLSKGFGQLAKLTNESFKVEYRKPYIEEEDLFLLMEDQVSVRKPSRPQVHSLDDLFRNMELQNEYHSEVHSGHSHSDGGIDLGDLYSETEGHDLEDVYEEDGHSHDGHSHEHSHEQVIIATIERTYDTGGDIFLERYAIYLLIGLLLFRCAFATITKCSLHRSTKREQEMAATQKEIDDSLVNVRPQPCRTDNIYTVTVTTQNLPSPDHNGTFVCFDKYIPDGTTGSVNTPSSSSSSNYLDMTYATHSSCPKSTEGENQPDLYEKNSDDGGIDDSDPTYNSIENENFEFVQEGIESRDDGRKSVDSFDVFDTYDNFVFKREAEAAAHDNLTTNTGNTDEMYCHYLPGTHL